jgi:ubiquinone/menaquinone biosynthesis C-methylase UbiE
MADVKGHRWFAATYDRLTASGERGFMVKVRAEVAGGAQGNVLEIDAGTGANFPYYTDLAEHVTAVEPDPYMFRRAQRHAAELEQHIELQQAPAEDLPFAEESFDSVVSTLVLCSVKDPEKSLGEVVRVLKPGGQLRFYEHIRSSNPVSARFQDVALPVWRWFAAGCHCNRDTVATIREAGLEITEVEYSTPVPPVPPFILVRPHVKGMAVRG